MEQLMQHRCVHSGTLLKRCRLSWRPRYIELVIDSGSAAAGHIFSFYLVIYDHHKQMIKRRISFEDIVTVRSCRDCNFQVFFSDGKILQLRTDSVSSQSHWMAMLKVGLGKGQIFHVQVHMTNNLEHALLYSIVFNLPAHRIGQLDRVLVLASPINDINLNAWDLNHVKSIIESDVGVRMDICKSCTRGDNERVTFVMEKCFIKDCIDFLLKEANVSCVPKFENGLLIYDVSHQCGLIRPPDMPAPQPPLSLPPPYSSQDEGHLVTFAHQDKGRSLTLPMEKMDNLIVSIEQENDQYIPMKLRSNTLMGLEPAYPQHLWDTFQDSRPNSESWNSTRESLFRADGSLSIAPHSKSNVADLDLYLPPRNIPRLHYESCIPALAQPYLKYQPHMYQQGAQGRFESPYQVSSRIIITDSGEVQFERNVMGNMPTSNRTGFVFKKQLPLPPRGLRGTTNGPAVSHELSVKSKVSFPVSDTALNTGRDISKLSDIPSPCNPHKKKLPPAVPPRSGAPARPAFNIKLKQCPGVPPRPAFNINQEQFLSSAHPSQGPVLRNREERSTTDYETERNQSPVENAHLPSSSIESTPHPPTAHLLSKTAHPLSKTAHTLSETAHPPEIQSVHNSPHGLKRNLSDSELATPHGQSAMLPPSCSPRDVRILSHDSPFTAQDTLVSDCPFPSPSSSDPSNQIPDAQNPISHSHVTDSKFFKHVSSPSRDNHSDCHGNDDSVFLPNPLHTRESTKVPQQVQDPLMQPHPSLSINEKCSVSNVLPGQGSTLSPTCLSEDPQETLDTSQTSNDQGDNVVNTGLNVPDGCGHSQTALSDVRNPEKPFGGERLVGDGSSMPDQNYTFLSRNIESQRVGPSNQVPTPNKPQVPSRKITLPPSCDTPHSPIKHLSVPHSPIPSLTVLSKSFSVPLDPMESPPVPPRRSGRKKDHIRVEKVRVDKVRVDKVGGSFQIEASSIGEATCKPGSGGSFVWAHGTDLQGDESFLSKSVSPTVVPYLLPVHSPSHTSQPRDSPSHTPYSSPCKSLSSEQVSGVVSTMKLCLEVPKTPPPIPKPRKTVTKDPQRPPKSKLSTSTSENYISETLIQSLEESKPQSRSTHTIVYNGKEIGVTDL